MIFMDGFFVFYGRFSKNSTYYTKISIIFTIDIVIFNINLDNININHYYSWHSAKEFLYF